MRLKHSFFILQKKEKAVTMRLMNVTMRLMTRQMPQNTQMKPQQRATMLKLKKARRRAERKKVHKIILLENSGVFCSEVSMGKMQIATFWYKIIITADISTKIKKNVSNHADYIQNTDWLSWRQQCLIFS